MLDKIILVSGVVSFLILLISKLGIREWVQIRAPKLISEMFGCDFCLSFWSSVAFCVTLSLITGDWMYMYSIIPSVPITRILIS